MLSGSPDTQVLHACRDDPAFRATRSPYLIVDRDLCIVGANPAYCEATLRAPAELVGRLLREAFPENRAAPDAGAAAAVTASMERVLRLGRRDQLPVLRDDVPVATGTPGFVERVWVAVNSPVSTPDGRVAGVLHHVEDVTGLLAPGAGGHPLAPAVAPARALDAENARLRERFEQHVSIEQAKGVLMARRGCSAGEAVELLRTLAHETDTTLHVVAETLLEDTARPAD